MSFSFHLLYRLVNRIDSRSKTRLIERGGRSVLFSSRIKALSVPRILSFIFLFLFVRFFRNFLCHIWEGGASDVKINFSEAYSHLDVDYWNFKECNFLGIVLSYYECENKFFAPFFSKFEILLHKSVYIPRLSNRFARTDTARLPIFRASSDSSNSPPRRTFSMHLNNRRFPN